MRDAWQGDSRQRPILRIAIPAERASVLNVSGANARRVSGIKCSASRVWSRSCVAFPCLGRLAAIAARRTPTADNPRAFEEAPTAATDDTVRARRRGSRHRWRALRSTSMSEHAPRALLPSKLPRDRVACVCPGPSAQSPPCRATAAVPRRRACHTCRHALLQHHGSRQSRQALQRSAARAPGSRRRAHPRTGRALLRPPRTASDRQDLHPPGPAGSPEQRGSRATFAASTPMSRPARPCARTWRKECA